MLPEKLLQLARRFEGLSLVPYICPAGVPTIGYGHTGRDVPAMGRIDRETAEAFLYIDMARAFVGAGKASPVLWTDEMKHAAIADFCFNLGVGRYRTSTLRRKGVDKGNWPRAAKELRRWVWGGGRRLPGLVRRREAEVALLLGNPAGGDSRSGGRQDG